MPATVLLHTQHSTHYNSQVLSPAHRLLLLFDGTVGDVLKQMPHETLVCGAINDIPIHQHTNTLAGSSHWYRYRSRATSMNECALAAASADDSAGIACRCEFACNGWRHTIGVLGIGIGIGIGNGACGGRSASNIFGPLCLLLLSLLPSVRKNIANKPRTHTHAHSPRYLLRPSLAYSESLAARLHWRARAVSKHSEKFSLTKRSKAKWRIWQRQS